MSLISRLQRQFGKPHGVLGHVVGWILENRSSNRRRNRWTVELLDLKPTDHVLEIGFGPGFAIGLVAASVPQGKVTGVDHSDVMIAQARKHNARGIREGRAVLHLGGIEKLAVLGEKFDKIFAVNVFQFLPVRETSTEIACARADFAAQEMPPNRVEALKLVLQVMRPGATLAITYIPRHEGATAADADRFAQALSQEMAQVGFEGMRVEKLDLKPMPAICLIGRAAESEAAAHEAAAVLGA